MKRETIVRFEKGKIYRTDTGRCVCMGRGFDKRNIERVYFYDLAEAREDMREGGYVEEDHTINIFEEYEVRVFKGVERATACDNTDDIEDYDVRADRPLGAFDFTPQKKNPKASRKSKKGNPLSGLILIVLIVLLMKACSGNF